MTYADKLKDPRWQKRRLQLLEAAGWQCSQCKTKTETLHVHHGVYRKLVEPWDYEDAVMHVLCDECHKDAEQWKQCLLERLAILPPMLTTGLGHALHGISDDECLRCIVTAFVLFTHNFEIDSPAEPTYRSVLEWFMRQAQSELWNKAFESGKESNANP